MSDTTPKTDSESEIEQVKPVMTEPPTTEPAAIEVVEPTSVSSRTRKRVKKTGKLASSLTSILIFTSITLLILLGTIILIREVRDDSYQITEFDVPPELINKGYSGKVIAYQVQDHIRYIISTASIRWSLKRQTEFSISSNESRVQVEVAGVGFSPTALIAYIKAALGIPVKTISGEFIVGDDQLRLIIRITNGKKVTLKTYQEPSSLKDLAIVRLVNRAAGAIIEANNPVILAMYYSGFEYDKNDMHSDSLSIELCKLAIRETPEQASDAYTWWAFCYIKMRSDSSLYMPKLRQAIKLNPNNAHAYRLWAWAYYTNPKRGIEILKKSISLDSTEGGTWYDLANHYSFIRVFNDSISSKTMLDYYRKAYQLKPVNEAYLNQYFVSLLVYRQFGELRSAYESLIRFQQTKFVGTEIAILNTLGDSTSARKIFEQELASPSHYFYESLADQLSWLALQITNENANFLNEAEYYAKLAIQADPEASYGYGALATVYGLQKQEELFYQTVEKALRKGWRAYHWDTYRIAPVYVHDERFKKLVIKYNAQVSLMSLDKH